MLVTPLGEIIIFCNNKKIEYKAVSIENDKTCIDLDGRYLITLHIEPNGKKQKISCKIKMYTPSSNDGIETGENLELKSFYKDKIKLSIGMEGDTGYLIDGIRYYDYDNNYLDDGVEYVLLEETVTDEYKFGIAWINNYTEDNDAQTWFGADPTMMTSI